MSSLNPAKKTRGSPNLGRKSRESQSLGEKLKGNLNLGGRAQESLSPGAKVVSVRVRTNPGFKAAESRVDIQDEVKNKRLSGNP